MVKQGHTVNRRSNRAHHTWRVRCDVCKRKKVYSAITWMGNHCPDCVRQQEADGPPMGEH